ncbi:uncharacterized protein LOC101238485 isoform X1 [Hydra vulgaris]|uniref:Uncharacterized protein LOC101238485 isoform X1 n=1 Tax=Hydra vulgaris TaxID=6087 RepID=A0ABM4CE11_HYDVU
MSLQVLRHLHNWSLRKEKLLKIDVSLHDKAHTNPFVVEINEVISKKRKAANSLIYQKSLKKIKKMDRKISVLDKFHKSKHANKLDQKILQKKFLPLSKKRKLVFMKKTLKCQYCSRRYSTEKVLFEHEKVCTIINHEVCLTQMSTLLFSCDICCERFMNQEALEQHLKCEHRSKPSCDKCFKMFECRRKLMEHDEFCAGMLDGKPIKKQTHGLISFICTSDIYMCSKCENPFPSQNHLRQHQILLRKKMPIDVVLEKDSDLPAVIELDNCNENEETSKTMEISLNNVVSFQYTLPFELGENSCMYCGKFFQNYSRLIIHGHICKRKLIYSCFFCSKMLRSEFRLNNHLSSCLKRKVLGQRQSVNLAKLFSCQYCKLLFPLKSLCKHHMRIEHKDTERNLRKCYIIKSKELIESSVKRNIANQSFKSFKGSSHRKPLCGSENALTITSTTPTTIFSTKNILVENYFEKKPLLCKYCDFVCMAEKVLASHLNKNHTNVSEKFNIVKCKNCFNVYLNEQDLNNHLCKIKKISNSESNVDLSRNTYSFHNYITDSHIQVNNKTSPLYSCCNCSQNFRRKKHYLKHTQVCKFQIPNIVKIHENSCNLNQFCYICGFTFDNIILHLVSHSHKRPFNCSVCKFRSNRAFAAYKHMHKKHNIIYEPYNHKNSDIHCKEHGFENCIKCHIYFLNRKDLLKHSEQDCINFQARIQNRESIHHLLKGNVKLQTKTHCMNCSINFHSKKLLLRHLKFCPFKNIKNHNDAPSITARRKVKQCPKCFKSFKYKLPLKKHVYRCSKLAHPEEQESQIIKPAGPAIESLLAENEEADVDVGVLVSLEDAKQSLMSLIIDDKCCKEVTAKEEKKLKDELLSNTVTTATITLHSKLLGELKQNNPTEKKAISEDIFCMATELSRGEINFLNSGIGFLASDCRSPKNDNTVLNTLHSSIDTNNSITNSQLPNLFNRELHKKVSNFSNSCVKSIDSESQSHKNDPTFSNTSLLHISTESLLPDSILPSQHNCQSRDNFLENKNDSINSKSRNKRSNFLNTLNKKNLLPDTLLSNQINRQLPKSDATHFDKEIISINDQSPKSYSNLLNTYICTETKNNLSDSPAIVCSYRLYPCRKCGVFYSEPEHLENHVHTFHKNLPEVNPTVQYADDANIVSSTCKTKKIQSSRDSMEVDAISSRRISSISNKIPVDNCHSFYSTKLSNDFGSSITKKKKDFQQYCGNYVNDKMTMSPPIGEDYGTSQFLRSIPHKNQSLHEGLQYTTVLPFSPVFFDPALSPYISHESLTVNGLSCNPSSYIPYDNSSMNFYRTSYPEPHNSFVISHQTPPTVGRWPYHPSVFPQPNFMNNSWRFDCTQLQTENSGNFSNNLTKTPLTMAEAIHLETQITKHQILNEQRSLPSLFSNDDSNHFLLDKYRLRLAEENFLRYLNSNYSLCGNNSFDKSVSCTQMEGILANNIYSPGRKNSYMNKVGNPNSAQSNDTIKRNYETVTKFLPNTPIHQTALPNAPIHNTAVPNKSDEIIDMVQEPFNYKRSRRKQSNPIKILEN